MNQRQFEQMFEQDDLNAAWDEYVAEQDKTEQNVPEQVEV